MSTAESERTSTTSSSVGLASLIEQGAGALPALRAPDRRKSTLRKGEAVDLSRLAAKLRWLAFS